MQFLLELTGLSYINLAFSVKDVHFYFYLD